MGAWELDFTGGGRRHGSLGARLHGEGGGRRAWKLDFMRGREEAWEPENDQD